MQHARSILRAASALALAAALSACPEPRTPAGPTRPPLAQKWFDRAKGDYVSANIDDAADEIRSAMQAAPDDAELKIWGGRIALARLEFAEAVRILTGVGTSEARGIRGRAHWYAGEIDAAADELEAMLQDPDVRDPWAKDIAALARRGAGRKPFQMSGGIVAPTEMPRVFRTSLVVPIEIDGEQGLALIATGTPEVMLDSTTRKEASWVSLRFGGRIEVKDVPARVQDLSAISRQMNAPIKALLGINLLRHLNATIDFTGSQFVVRNYVPPPPPNATRVPLYYFKGGGMVLRSALKAEKDPAPASLLVDSVFDYPIALDEAGWKKAGIDVAQLQATPQDPKLKQGLVPIVRLGAFDIPGVPGVFGPPPTDRLADIEKGLDVDLDGMLGSAMLAEFSVTLTEDGRGMWLEFTPMPAELAGPPDAKAAPPPAEGGAAAPPDATPPATEEPKPGAGATKPPPAAAKPSKGGKKPSDRPPPNAR
jgi:hypothetical protein